MEEDRGDGKYVRVRRGTAAPRECARPHAGPQAKQPNAQGGESGGCQAARHTATSEGALRAHRPGRSLRCASDGRPTRGEHGGTNGLEPGAPRVAASPHGSSVVPPSRSEGGRCHRPPPLTAAGARAGCGVRDGGGCSNPRQRRASRRGWQRWDG